MTTAHLERERTIVPVHVPFGTTTPLHLRIGVGACRLSIKPGDGEAWVTGTYYGPVEALPLEITSEGGTVRITQRHDWDHIGRLFGEVPTLELALGKAAPYALTIESGASENNIDLGGIPLTNVTLRQGAGKIIVDFSSPNPQEMKELLVSSGASSIEMEELANANFAGMFVEGGAASYKFDFRGELRRDAQVRITTAMSSTEILVPSTTPVRIVNHTLVGGTNVGEGFTNWDGAYWTEAALAQRNLGRVEPSFHMQINLTMGSLALRAE